MNEHTGDAIEQSRLARTLQGQLNVATSEWRQVAPVNQNLVARTRRSPTRRYRAEECFPVPIEQAKEVHAEKRRYPLSQRVPHTPTLKEPEVPSAHLVDLVQENLGEWLDCTAGEAKSRLNAAVARSERDEREARGQRQGRHKQRATLGKEHSECIIGPDEFHLVVNRVLNAGFTLHIPAGHGTKIRSAIPICRGDWGFDSNLLRLDGIEFNWPDRELLFFLK